MNLLLVRARAARLVGGLLLSASLAGAGCGGASHDLPSGNEVDPSSLSATASAPASKDTYVRGDGFANRNFGAEHVLVVGQTLIAFDEPALAALTAGGRRVTSARLEVTIVDNLLPRGRSRSIDAFRMTHDWTELGATFECANDARPGNDRSDCRKGDDWEFGTPSRFRPNPWATPATATVVLTAAQGGKLSFDVTADVQAFVAGKLPNFGWLLQARPGFGTDVALLGSRRSATPSRLIVTTGCSVGFDDCDHDPANGCEQALDTADHCGACGVSCDDANPCTADSCDASGACRHAPVADGATCDDGNACTTGDACLAGSCGGASVACAAADACHAAGSCNPTTGACSNPAAPDGTACTDGNACTTGDACAAGSCVGAPLACVAADACHAAGSCDPATGACSNPAAPDGTACTDGNACTDGDACVTGVCQAGSPPACPSDDGCHPGVCDPASGACSNVVACHFYGTGTISGTAIDGLSVSPRVLEDGTSNNQVGGIGSAIAYTGSGNLYVATPDRGPNAGADSYADRYYLINLSLDGGKVTPTIRGAAGLDKGPGLATFIGLDTAFDAANSTESRRLNPEGVRVGPTGTLFVSDEYGPFVYEFSPDGHRLRALTVPDKFLIDHPGIEDAELPPTNTKGRQANRGMEGLALSPDGSKLYGLMQSPLIQDNGLTASGSRLGTNVRILEIDVASGQTRELLYPMDKPKNGNNEILAINDHQLLVLERDNNAGTDASIKKLFLIDISGATDISGIPSLPATAIPAGVTPVTKKLFLDLLDPAFGLAGASFPEKIEGMAFGPDLPDGRHVLVVTSDNDFISTQNSNLYVFAIDPIALPGLKGVQTAFPTTCAAPKPVECPASGACFLPGSCNPGTGACSTPTVAAGTPTGAQVSGDCQQNQCDGAGNAVAAGDPKDVPASAGQCTVGVCLATGQPGQSPVPAGTSCGENGGIVCDGAGSCVSCATASDCPGEDTECSARACVGGGCGFTFAPAGTPSAIQTAGDCHVRACDGQGNLASVVDDADQPIDGNPCTDDACTGGVPSNPPTAAGAICGSGNQCDGTGNCVGCLTASDCPGVDSECAARTCGNGLCGFTFAPAGLPVAAQLPGDCQQNQCDGAGRIVSVADDADLPVDARQCTFDVCTGGVPSNPARPAGATCSESGGQLCDGLGACVAPPTFRVARIGDGTAALSSAGTAVFIEERRIDNGALVSVVALPAAASGGNQPFVVSGSATSEGALSLSGDGRFLVMGGYAASAGTAGVASAAVATIRRSVARVDAAGNIDTSTLLTAAFDANNVRSATSFDGTGFWVGGAGGNTGGVWFISLGTAGGTRILATPNNVRCLSVIGGQLYSSSNNGTFVNVFTVGTGLPTTAGQVATSFPGMPTSGSSSPFAFALFDRDPSVAGPDVLYVADDRAAASGGGIQKWTFNGVTWTLTATFNVATTPIGFRGVTGTVTGGNVALIGSTADTAGNRLVTFVDDGSTTVTGTVIGAAATNTLFRGVALSPHN